MGKFAHMHVTQHRQLLAVCRLSPLGIGFLKYNQNISWYCICMRREGSEQKFHLPGMLRRYCSSSKSSWAELLRCSAAHRLPRSALTYIHAIQGPYHHAVLCWLSTIPPTNMLLLPAAVGLQPPRRDCQLHINGHRHSCHPHPGQTSAFSVDQVK